MTSQIFSLPDLHVPEMLVEVPPHFMKNLMRMCYATQRSCILYVTKSSNLPELLQNCEVVVCDRVCVMQHLEQAGRLPDAAVAFLACKATEDAIRCYEHAGEWQMAFALLLQSKPDATRIRTLGLSLVDHLKVDHLFH